MQRAAIIALCFASASAIVLRGQHHGKDPQMSVPGVCAAGKKPHTPDSNDEHSMCDACKIRACNNAEMMPTSGEKACRCRARQNNPGVDPAAFDAECQNMLTDAVDGWKNCGSLRDCEALEGQCVVGFEMAAPEPAAVPDHGGPKMSVPGVCDAGVKPHQPDTNNKHSMCQACKIRACNNEDMMPTTGENACRCRSRHNNPGVEPAAYDSECQNMLTDAVDGWENCGSLRDCDTLEGQCVVGFEMAAPKPPSHHSSAIRAAPVLVLALAFLA